MSDPWYGLNPWDDWSWYAEDDESFDEHYGSEIEDRVIYAVESSIAVCCCHYGSARSGEWPEFECEGCPRHIEGIGQPWWCRRHKAMPIPKDPKERAALARMAGLSEDETKAIDQWCNSQQNSDERRTRAGLERVADLRMGAPTQLTLWTGAAY